MELKAKFDVTYMEEALVFLESLPDVKKTQKAPESEISHAEALRKNYYKEKKK